MGPGLDPPIDKVGDPTGDVDRLQETVGKAGAREGERPVVQYGRSRWVETRPGGSRLGGGVKQEDQVGYMERVFVG